MNTKLKLVAAATSAALIAGCASGGGGPGGSGVSINGQPATLEEAVACIYTVGLVCPEAATSSSQPVGSSSGPLSPGNSGYGAPEYLGETGERAMVFLPFVSWSALRSDQAAEAGGPYISLSYQSPFVSRPGMNDFNPYWSYSGAITSAGEPWTALGEPYESHLQYDSQGKLRQFNGFITNNAFTDLATIGQPGIEVARNRIPNGNPLTSITSPSGYEIGLVVNPYVLGWNYQSFGVWDTQHKDGGYITSNSFGAATPATAVPTTGSATFTGKVSGFYVSPSGQGSVAAANLAATANFNTRSIGFASTGTTLTRDLSQSVATPSLNLNGTLTYSPGTNNFTGTLRNAGGTMSGVTNGQFYGPAAQELGGVFAIKAGSGPESFIGAYGAKR